MGRGSPLCQSMHLKIVEHFKSFKHKITKNLGIPLSTVHNISNTLRESEEISMCKGQGRQTNIGPRRALKTGKIFLHGFRNTRTIICEHCSSLHTQI